MKTLIALVTILLISVLLIGGYFIYHKQSDINEVRNEEAAHNAARQLVDVALRQAERNLGEKVSEAIRDHRVIVGMSKSDVRLAIGEPNGIGESVETGYSVDISYRRDGIDEIWHYYAVQVMFNRNGIVMMVLKERISP
ncbi:MAG: hypothetical protein IPP19_11435 [Verrucomicrobia bacterium]|nr:hypothetical protein [Verrucomicrobiota bacterium]